MFNAENFKTGHFFHSLAIYDQSTQVSSPCLPNIHHYLIRLSGVKEEIIGGTLGCQILHLVPGVQMQMITLFHRLCCLDSRILGMTILKAKLKKKQILTYMFDLSQSDL